MNKKSILLILATLSFVANLAFALSESPTTHTETKTQRKEFTDINQLEEFFTTQGFVIIGRFSGSDWPAKVAYEKSAETNISFILKNGGPQSYPNYHDYLLKVVAVEDEAGNETVVVFRSKDPLPKK